MIKKRGLDIGCGDTWRKDNDTEWEGLDIYDFGQKWKFDVEHTDLRELFEPNTFDRVYASHFLEHLSGHRVIKLVNDELVDILKDGGELWAVVPHKDHEKACSLWHMTYWTEFTFRNLLEEVTYHNNEVTKKKLWEITELVTNSRPHIHCKAILHKAEKVDLPDKPYYK